MRHKLPFHYGYTVVAACFLMMFVIVGLAMSCAGLYYRPVSAELGVGVGDFGLCLSFNFLASTLSLPLAGRLMERHSARWLLTAASATVGLVFVAMSQFSALWQFYLAGAVTGVALAFLLYLGFPTLLNRWFRRRMGVFLGLCSAGSGLGGVVLNPVVGHLIAAYGWRTSYAVSGLAVLLLVTPLLALLLRDRPEAVGLRPYGDSAAAAPAVAAAQASSTSVAEPAPARSGLLLGVLVAFAFLLNAVATLNVFIPTHVQLSGHGVEHSALAAAAAMTGVTVGKVLLGLVNDRSPLLGLTVTVGLGAAGLFLLLLSAASLAWALVGAFSFGWAYAGVTVQTPMLVRAVFGRSRYARVYARVSMSIAIGGAVAAGGWGLLADETSFRFVFLSGIGLLAVCGALGLAALTAARRRTAPAGAEDRIS